MAPDYVPQPKMLEHCVKTLLRAMEAQPSLHLGAPAPLGSDRHMLGLGEGFASVLQFPRVPSTFQNDPKHEQLSSGQ